MNKRRLSKALYRLRHLPLSANLVRYFYNKCHHYTLKSIHSTQVAYPSTIMLELGNHCNLHCTTCAREYDYGKQMDKGYMKIGEAKKIVDELSPYLDSIGLTGMGETYLYNELPEIVDYIKEKNKGIIVSVSTNAMLPDFMDRVKKTIGKIDTIQISIDGLGSVYESIRINAHFETLDRNLRELQALTQKTDTDLMLNMVVTKENYHQMPDLVRYAQNKKIKFLNFTLFNLSSVTNIDASYYDFYNSPEFKNALLETERVSETTPEVLVTNWDYLRKNEFKKCPFPVSHFYICWNGYIAPCCGKPFPKELHFGNVFETGVLGTLNSRSYRGFRQLWYKNQAPDFCKKCHFTDIKPIDISRTRA